jgi:hypothetical protein
VCKNEASFDKTDLKNPNEGLTYSTCPVLSCPDYIGKQYSPKNSTCESDISKLCVLSSQDDRRLSEPSSGSDVCQLSVLAMRSLANECLADQQSVGSCMASPSISHQKSYLGVWCRSAVRPVLVRLTIIHQEFYLGVGCRSSVSPVLARLTIIHQESCLSV